MGTTGDTQTPKHQECDLVIKVLACSVYSMAWTDKSVNKAVLARVAPGLAHFFSNNRIILSMSAAVLVSLFCNAVIF